MNLKHSTASVLISLSITSSVFWAEKLNCKQIIDTHKMRADDVLCLEKMPDSDSKKYYNTIRTLLQVKEDVDLLTNSTSELMYELIKISLREKNWIKQTKSREDINAELNKNKLKFTDIFRENPCNYDALQWLYAFQSITWSEKWLKSWFKLMRQCSPYSTKVDKQLEMYYITIVWALWDEKWQKKDDEDSNKLISLAKEWTVKYIEDKLSLNQCDEEEKKKLIKAKNNLERDF